LPPIPPPAAAIDAQLHDFQQGDALLTGDIPFVFLADYYQPITPESQQAAEADQAVERNSLGTVLVEAPGFAILTQTCDLVRSCSERPLVQVAALVSFEADILDLGQAWL
jgi:hypothetical protein